jgi:hypothetical protein
MSEVNEELLAICQKLVDGYNDADSLCDVARYEALAETMINIIPELIKTIKRVTAL